MTYPPYNYQPPDYIWRMLDKAAQHQRMLEKAARHQKMLSKTADSINRLQPVIDLATRVAPLMATIEHAAQSANRLGAIARNQETIARILKSHPTLPVPTARDLDEAEADLLSRLPQTPEDVREVEQAIAQIDSDPERVSLIGKLTSGITRDDVKELSAWALLVLVGWLLFKMANLPVTADLSPAQEAALSNEVNVIAIIVAMAAIILARK